MSGYSDSMRREMAERIRFAAYDGTDKPLGKMKGLLGLEAKDTYRTVFCKLADLIEPRECTMKIGADGICFCSECSAMLEVKNAVYDTNGGLPPRYCANCGAKVTSWE